MAPTSKRRGQASKDHSSPASTLKIVQTDDARDSAELSSFGVPYMSQNSRDDPRKLSDAEKLTIEWNDFMTCNFEVILLENLFGIFIKAIRQIAACGYSEEDAESAVLKSGLYYGFMGTLLNIVNGALIFLKMGEDFGPSKCPIFENLNSLVEYLMLEMVCVLKEARPSLTVADAMSGLMLSNMDLLEAYTMDGGNLRSFATVGHELCEAVLSHPNYADTSQDSLPPSSRAQWWPEHDAPDSMDSYLRASFTGNKTSNSDPSPGGSSFGEHLHDVGQMFNISGHCKSYKSEKIVNAKVTNWGAFVLTKRLNYLNSVNSNTNTSCSKSSVAGDNLSAATVSALPTDTPIDFTQEEKDKIILSLSSQVKMLKEEHQNLTEWANKNVMLAAQMLREDQAELKALRKEKETVEKSEKYKQHNRDESASKRVSAVEHALDSSTSHLKIASSTMSKLEEVNSVLKEEMKAAKLQARESAANLQEALMREQEALKTAQSWEGKKSLLLEELSADKQKVAALQIALEKAKGLYSKIEVRSKQEEMEKERILAEARYIACEREQLKSLAEEEEEAIRESAETELQKGKLQIKSLETKLFELKSKSESSKLSQVRRKVKGSCGGNKVVRMERECVMCMTEEKSVVFLPCAHQSLCERCNKLHDEQGMKDCPSCRTPIKGRIRVRFAAAKHP